MSTLRYAAAAILCFYCTEAAGGAPGEEFLSLDWTDRQVEDGHVSHGFHNHRLLCAGKRCRLETVTLNQCTKNISGEDGFFPKAEYWSTDDGDLHVRFSGRTLTLRVDAAPGATITYRLELDKDRHLAGVSGGMVKDSYILGKVITVEFRPAYSDGAILIPMKLDCPPFVTAIPKPSVIGAEDGQ